MYLDIFIDSYLSAIWFAAHAELYLQIVLDIPDYSKTMIFAASTAGWVLGLVTNWIMGYLLISIFIKKIKASEEVSSNYEKSREFFRRKLFWINIFSAFNPRVLLIGVFPAIKGHVTVLGSLKQIMDRDVGYILFGLYSSVLSFVSGVFRVNFWLFLFMVTLSRVLYFVTLLYTLP